MKRRILALLAAVALLLCALPAGVLAAAEEIEITSAEELAALSDKCRLDSWSRDKKVVLRADIDLAGSGFEPIPSFGGTFEGNGHTISGLELTEGGSAVGGLFRYVQEGGTVRELNVEGRIDPGANAEVFGGIVGENSGRIVNCSFSGTVSGSSDIGGIAGVNTDSGELYGCRSLAIVSGEHYTGGIVGRNLGSVSNCTNLGAVNTTNPELEAETLDIDWDDLNSTENVAAHTDTGGIAGFSQGEIELCVNRGNVGYPHVGYNVGGIVGRQSGYVGSCRNFGLVNGRKDVGGVVGQLVPSIKLQFSSSAITQLEAEMDLLQSMLDGLISDFQGSSSEVSDILSEAGTYLESAGHSASAIGDALVGFVDGNIQNINDFAATAARYAEGLADMAGYVEECFGHIGSAAGHLSDFITALEQSAGELAEVLEDANYALEKVVEAENMLQSAAGMLQSAVDELGAYFGGVSDDLQQGLEDLEGSLPEGEVGSGSAPDGEDDPFTGSDAESGESVEIGTVTPVVPGGEELGEIVDKAGQSLEEFAATVDSVSTKVGTAVNLVKRASSLASDAVENGLMPALDKLGELAADTESLTSPLRSAVDELGGASSSLASAAGRLETWLRDISREDTDIFEGLGEDFVEEADRMDAALVGLSGQMEKLNEAMSGSVDTMSTDLRSINNQFFKVMDAFMAMVEGSESSLTVYEDMSEEALFSARDGKVEDCENRGNTDGDVNVGGLVGTMAIEYDLDPEEDISVSGSASGSFRYFTNAVLMNSANFNDVTAKKNDVGGAVGFMDLGIVYGCENYGNITSTSGDYAGGIVGESASAIRKCWSLAYISGRDYVGGIAGSATDVSSCRAIVRTSASGGWKGAIAGEVLGEAAENYFVGEGQGGIDGVSYKGKAEPQEYEEFVKAEGLPGEFESFSLTFATDHTLVKRLSFSYGGSIDPTEIPAVPARSGYVGQWESYDFSNLTFSDTVDAIYIPYDTVIAVDKLVGKRPVLLLEGSFLPDTKPVFEEYADGPEGCIEAWSVRAEGSTEPGFTLRYLCPEAKGDVAVYVLSDGGWKRVETSSESSYLLFESNTKQICFAAVELERDFPLTEIAIVCAAGLVLAALVLIMRLRLRKKK